MRLFFAILCGVICASCLSAFGADSIGNLAHKDAQFTEFFRQTNDWAAGDGAISIPLSDGRVLWLFGDSYVDQFDAKTGTLPCLFSARNAVLVQARGNAHPKLLRNPLLGEKTFFRPPETPKGEAWPCFWPGAGFQSGDTIYVYEMEMQRTKEGGLLGFTGIGQCWAKISFPELQVLNYSPLPDMNGISFWCGFVTDKKGGLTYAYGDKGHGIGSDVYVARFPTQKPDDNWTYWDGTNWSANPTNAAVIGSGASFSVGVCEVRGKYVLTTSSFSVACDQGRDIYISVANSPTGPFPPRRWIYTVDDTVKGHHPFFYAVFAHPEFLDATDQLLITYSINGYEPAVPSCVDGRFQPDYYRPRAIRLPLRYLGP